MPSFSLFSLSYHIYLVCIGQTTNENIRAVYDATVNPYDQGCCQNYFDMCCSSAPTSNLPNMAEVISEDEFLLNLGPAFAAAQARGRAEAERAMETAACGRSLSPTKNSISSAAALALAPLSSRISLGRVASAGAVSDVATNTPLLSKADPKPPVYDR